MEIQEHVSVQIIAHAHWLPEDVLIMIQRVLAVTMDVYVMAVHKIILVIIII